MKLNHHQRGMGFISMILSIFAIVVIVSAGFLLGPIYFEHHTVKGILDKMPTRGVIKAHSTSTQALKATRMYFQNNFRVQNIRNVPIEQITVTRYTQGYEVHIRYEVRRPAFYNVDVVVSFDDKLKVPFAR